MLNGDEPLTRGAQVDLQVTVSTLDNRCTLTVVEPGSSDILARWNHQAKEAPIWISAITTAYLSYMRDQGASSEDIGMVPRAIVARAMGIMTGLDTKETFWYKQFGGKR